MVKRSVSFSKYRRIERDLRDALRLKDQQRREALDICAFDPNGTSRLDDLRAKEIANYCGARRWVTHYRDLLAHSTPTKFANQHAYAVSP